MGQALPAAMNPPNNSALTGVWAAIFTPFLSDGALDLNGAASNAKTYRQTFGLDGVFCNGIMGESWSLTFDERKAVLEAILDGAGSGLKVGVVVTHNAIRETIALARHAGEAGADHVVLMRPRGPWSVDALAACAEAVADAAGRPVTLFESTAPGMTFGVDAIAAIGARIGIHGIKATGGVKSVTSLGRRFPDLSICDPHEDQWFTTLLTRGDRPLYADPEPYLYLVGGIDLVRTYQNAALSGDSMIALDAWRRLAPMRAIYNEWIIGPLNIGQSPAPALKHWAERQGLATGPVRFPLQPLPVKDAARLTQELDSAAHAIRS